MTKTLTLNSEFFQNECAESFCKAILGNLHQEYTQAYFVGYSKFKGFFFTSEFVDRWFKEITFKLDDSFSVDWACLHSHGYCYSINLGGNVLNLDYLVTLQGVIIEEAGE
jgi:hypothetical protein